MTSASPRLSPLVSVSLHEEGTLLRIALDRSEADMPTMTMMQAVAGVLNAVERQYVGHILRRRDGNEGICAYLQRRKPAWEDR